ncbi:hypothetical protein VNI00_016627 [Paramarasmius palmivorus]|uniref:Uncharacterized protein n=1 Tax=Paramarasmius palmivorus TaxID=297713 RepID=A0AAW0BCF0_9AGAR
MESKQQRLAFIHKLNLDSPQDNRSVTIIGSQAIAFGDVVDGQKKQDVMNSCLFAQLAANKKYNKQTQLDECFKTTPHAEKLGFLSVDALVINKMSGVFSAEELVLLKAIIARIENDEGEFAARLFNSSAIAGDTANFSFGLCSSDENNNAAVHVGYYGYTTKAEIADVLRFEFGDAEVKFIENHQQMVLNSQIYEQVREQVIEKLGTNYIAVVEI